MGTVNIGIGHDDDFIITKFFNIEIFRHPCAESGNHSTDGIGIQHLIQSCFFHIQNFAAEWKNRLITPITARFGRTARGITFDDIDFRELWIFLRAIGQFAGKAGNFERILTACQFSCPACRFSRAIGRNGFGNNFFGFRRMFFQIGTESVGNNSIHNPLDVLIA